MSGERRRWAARYGAAVMAVGIALFLKLTIAPLIEEDSPFLLFFAAVMTAALLGGLVPGLLATGLAALAAWYFFLPPYQSFGIDNLGQLLRLTMFALEGALIASLVSLMHAARERAEASALRARGDRQRLARSEERFRLLVEGVRDYAIVMLTPEGRVASWNEGARRVFGYEDREILGRHFSVFFSPKDRWAGLPGREVERAISEGCVSEENWAVRKDGSCFWANGSTNALRDEAGDLRGLVKVVRDRTEARRAEEELRLRDRAIAASTNGIVITDPNLPDGPIVYANPAFEAMTGYAVEETLGRNCRFLQGEDRDQPQLEELREALREGRPCEVVLRNYKKDGTLFYNELSVSPVLDEEGRVARFVGVQDDVTGRKRAEEALKRSEERFRSLVRYASDIVVILDREGTILFESPVVERVLGFAPEERMGKNAFGYLHPEDRAAVAEKFARLAGEPGGRVSAEYRTRDSRGDWRSFEAMGVNLLEDPAIRGIVVNSRDVTERKRAEEALREIREAERNRIARELHDGVLQDLSYVAQAMEVTRVRYEGTGVEDELGEQAEAVRRATRELREAIYDLRAYKHRNLNVDQILESLVELNRTRMPGCRIDLDVEEGFFDNFSERGGLEVLRIVQEALTNVRRHSGARNARVSLGSSGAAVRVEVSDDGRGFDPDAPPGMGTIGMHERAQTLGGELQIEGEPGAGTTVRFEVLPDRLPEEFPEGDPQREIRG